MKTFFLFVLASLLIGPAIAADVLKGSPGAMQRQNEQADAENLSRLTEKQLETFKKKKLLVPLPKNKGITIDERLPEKYRWCRPWVRRFLIDLGNDFHKKFGNTIQVNSAVRTAEYQAELRGMNGNAASAKPGPRQSSHLTGATIDVAKRGMSSRELEWMRSRLTVLEKRGFIEATEEHRQRVFHIMVFKKYKKSR